MSREIHVRFCESAPVRFRCATRPVVESFFDSLKTELITLDVPRPVQETRSALFEFIEVFYNRQRLHSALDYVPPAEYELAQAA